MLIKTQHTTLLQIFSKIVINFKVIFKNIKSPDNTVEKKSPGMKGLRDDKFIYVYMLLL